MTAFRQKGTCASQGCWLDRRWDPDSLGKAALAAGEGAVFPRGISAGDLDGFVEIGGQHLFVETKSVGSAFEGGQRRAFESIARQGNTVLVQWVSDNPSDEVVGVLLLVPGGEATAPQPCTRLERDRILARWSAWADNPQRGPLGAALLLEMPEAVAV